MKLIIISVLLLIISTLFLFSGWEIVNQGSNYSLFMRIECFDTNNCVMLGDAFFTDGSEVKVTNDGGKSWNSTLHDNKIVDYNGLKLYPTRPYSIAYPNINTCIMVGDSGNIWLSKDGAQTWSKSCLLDRHIIFDIKMANKNFGGLITPKSLYLTSNGGLTWDSTKIIISDSNYKPSTLKYLNILKDSTIIIEAYRYDKYSYIIRSLNLGKDWECFPKTEYDIGAITFINKDTGFAPGVYKVAPSTKPDVIFKTTDGGKTWVKKLDSTEGTGAKGLNKIIMFGNTGHAIGRSNYYWKSNNKGDSWTKDTSLNDFLEDVSMPSEHVYYGVEFYGKKIYKYTDYSTGVEDINPNESILLYPNPISSGNKLYLKLNSDFSDNYSLSLYNSLGQRVGNEYQTQETNTVNLEYDTSGLLPGIYFLSIKTKVKSIIKSFIVE